MGPKFTINTPSHDDLIIQYYSYHYSATFSRHRSYHNVMYNIIYWSKHDTNVLNSKMFSYNAHAQKMSRLKVPSWYPLFKGVLSFVNSPVFDEKNLPEVWVYIVKNSLDSLSVKLLKISLCRFCGPPRNERWTSVCRTELLCIVAKVAAHWNISNIHFVGGGIDFAPNRLFWFYKLSLRDFLGMLDMENQQSLKKAFPKAECSSSCNPLTTVVTGAYNLGEYIQIKSERIGFSNLYFIL